MLVFIKTGMYWKYNEKKFNLECYSKQLPLYQQFETYKRQFQKSCNRLKTILRDINWNILLILGLPSSTIFHLIINLYSLSDLQDN